MATALTQTGQKLIGEYLEAWSLTRDWMLAGKDPRWAPLKVGTDRDGSPVLILSLPNGDGACAAAARKLFRDGFAIGQYSWTRGRNLVVTDAGVQAYLASQVSA